MQKFIACTTDCRVEIRVLKIPQHVFCGQGLPPVGAIHLYGNKPHVSDVKYAS